MLIRALVTLGLVGISFGLSGCATTGSLSTESPEQTLKLVCEYGRSSHSIQGDVWLKAKSKEATGQFPATVKMSSATELQMEVTNLIGGTEAMIRIDHGKYTIEVPGNAQRHVEKRVETGYGSWGGIPLRWATELFIGRFPCPSSMTGVNARWEGASLVVETPASVQGGGEKFKYQLKDWFGKIWPQSVEWERSGNFSTKVKFDFEEPDDQTGSPQRWTAISDLGEVKVRWRKRVRR